MQLPFIARFDFEACVGERKQPAAPLAFAPWTSGAAPPDLF